MSSTRHHWLVAGQVITRDKQAVERKYNLNSILLTEKQFITKDDIGKSQQGLQMRFVTQCEQIKGAEIVDVFLMGFSHLGEMERDEFHGVSSADKAENKLN